MVTSCQHDLRSEDPSTVAKKNGVYHVHAPYVHKRAQCLDLEKNNVERGHQGWDIC